MSLDPLQSAGVLVQLVLVAITFKLFCGVPVCVLVLVDIVQNAHLERSGVPLSESASDRVRLGVWLASTASAYGMYYSLKYATSLVGTAHPLTAPPPHLRSASPLLRLTSPLLDAASARYATSLVGINSILISVLLPMIFYLMLHRRRMGPLTRAAYVALCVLAVLASLVISYVDVLQFLDEVSGDERR